MHCIGVDVSKQELVTFDGATERVFPMLVGWPSSIASSSDRWTRWWCSSRRVPTRAGWRRCVAHIESGAVHSTRGWFRI